MSYLDDVNERRRSQSDRQQTAVMMKALQSQKPSIILTDSTDLGEHISKLGTKIVDVLEEVRSDKSTAEQIDLLTNLTLQFRKLVESVQKSQDAQTDRIVDALNNLATAQKNQKPVVVPAPSVSLAEKDVDFKPLIKSLKELLKSPAPSFDLSKFRAHDLDNTPDNMQYVGFINSDGDWYILQHDPESNRDRYYFGTESYEQAWDEKHTLDYKTLSEARRALSA